MDVLQQVFTFCLLVKSLCLLQTPLSFLLCFFLHYQTECRASDNQIQPIKLFGEVMVTGHRLQLRSTEIRLYCQLIGKNYPVGTLIDMQKQLSQAHT